MKKNFFLRFLASKDSFLGHDPRKVCPYFWFVGQEQYAGKGRQGHDFSSPKGGLYVTLLYRPPQQQDCRSPKVLLTPFLTWLAKDLLDDLLPQHKDSFGLKWKNDLFYGHHKKIGGAMVTLEEDSLGYSWWIASLGLNINSYFPKDKSWSSVYGETGKSLDLSSFFYSYKEKLEKFLVYFHLQEDFPQGLLDSINKSFQDYGTEVFLQSPEGWHHGFFWGLGENGKIILEEKKNEKKFYDGLALFPSLCHYKNMPL